MEPKLLKSRQDVRDFALKMRMDKENGNVATLKDRISRHLDSVKDPYKVKSSKTDEVNFWTNEGDQIKI